METNLNIQVPSVPVRNHVGKQPSAGASVPAVSAATLPPAPEAVRQDINSQLREAEAKRTEAIRRAAGSFALSDQRFTIYKDLSGQYITRFTSLRDGRVTYIPEPDVLSWLNQGKHAANPALSLEV